MSDTNSPADLSAPFTTMAEKIVLNQSNGFAGAFVIQPPDGDAQAMLLLDSAGSPAIFWSTLRTRVEIALAELEQAERQGGVMGGRR